MPGCEDVGSGAEGYPPPRGRRAFVTGWGTKQGVLATVTGATAWPVQPLGSSPQKAGGRAEGWNLL